MTQEPTQLDEFKQAARDLVTDDEEGRYQERLGRLVQRGNDQKPPEHAPGQKRGTGVFGRQKPAEEPQ